MKPFPKNFLWGAAISSYQTEGNNFASDWWQWEQQPGNIKDGSVSSSACDFWNQYETYLDYAKQAGMNALRISIEWARIQPEQNQWSQQALDHYKKIIGAMKQRGLEPIVTLWHFTLPLWFAKQNGWLNENAQEYFLQYVKRVYETLKNGVRYWITLNEPSVYLFNGFITGSWPPGKKLALHQAVRIRNKLIRIHKAAYHILKNQNTLVSIAANLSWDTGASQYKNINRLLEWLPPRGNDWAMLHATQRECDFIGLNYYFHNTIRANVLHPFASVTSSHKDPSRNSDIGWEIAPQGIYEVSKKLYKTFHKPIMITENGLADAKDEKRAQFIRDHVKNIAQAIEKNIPVIGYLHWSLMDNFEWALGKTPRFGLIEMDYNTMTAHPRQSLWEYGTLIRQYINIAS
ncbi:MAG: hypothetical protein COX12_00325 [Candidatus Brennerbacteria bacterium CG23_combo_of_CG06-09_8_20_14_all_44_41]|uniref:Glycoside hydrolase family 1 protein n=2 Tax=Candidatus Brenneribacteriota TaxID=1817902 RepID=A0A2H9N610_9BACT|nr:MAG: hypothetical protein AUJ43_02330 [Parcubacteria group bacterium CG1_02_44_31]PIP50609.1 MAG: hypothetical protein COX12_00325 [Candidatus Brennerbacteria bacterium CG23_combo_of_CG06-09_8_20_14_all_44_41]PIX29309.1 MAG: hypothetical protein COZ64_00475 [Candidatus Brennerbacteria bacterium CG_4_8_14_3_um_filter_43_14]PJA19139.1 MAG: hypothetical protein COX61_02125 [Candidatus Brennerbacteria bacterium CG_4_10_14_0_2_um_filter_43_14]